jgi:Uma2 family endonuclease
VEAGRTLEARVFPASMGFRCYPDDPSKFRKPDVSVVRADRLAKVDSQEGFVPIPADLAVEVVSPNDLATDVAEKVQEYLANGFGLVWVVYPDSRTVVVYRPDGSANLLRAGDEITAGAALPGFRCKVGEFFGTGG